MKNDALLKAQLASYEVDRELALLEAENVLLDEEIAPERKKPDEGSDCLQLMGCSVFLSFVLSFVVVSTGLLDNGSSGPTREQNEQKSSPMRESLWLEKGKASVRLKLKDPKSTEFRNVFFSRGFNNIPCACGEVNSKNSLGGFTGFQRFVSGGTAELTFLEEEVSDFDKVWVEMCGPDIR